MEEQNQTEDEKSQKQQNPKNLESFPIKMEEQNKNEDEKSRWIRASEVLFDYSEISTFAGVIYIFMKDQSLFGRIYWISWFVFLFILGTYWSIQAYYDWTSSPVLTVVYSTGISLVQLPFPGIVFCTEGLPSMIFQASFDKLLHDFMEENNLYRYKYSPIETRVMLKRHNSGKITLTDEDMTNLIYGFRGLFINGSNVLDFVTKGFNTTTEGEYPNQATKTFIDLMLALSNFVVYDLERYIKVNEYQIGASSFNSNTSVLGFYFNPEALKNQLEACGGISCDSRGPSYYLTLLDYDTIFETIISILWYSRMPCFDVRNLTAMNDNDAAFVKICLWKGVQIPCSAIFSAIPTDDGMCCSFNMNSADDIFTESIYSKAIIRLQNRDKASAFGNTTLTDWYVQNNEPLSKAGTKMGLQVVLDAHTDLLDGLCIKSNYDSFTALIVPSNEFPLTIQKGFSIKRGYHTKVAMTGTLISADESLRNIDPILRGCLFADEYKLKLYKNYTQANCFFECTLNYTQKLVKENNNMSKECTPWSYPFVDPEQFTCDPFITKSIIDNMSANVPDSVCDHCLPDCNYNSYNYKLSDEPYRKCDDFNFGISPLCDFERKDASFTPVMWGNDVVNQLQTSDYLKTTLPNYIKKIPSNMRKIKPLDQILKVLESTYIEYDAFERDIATVSIYFDTTTVWQFSTQASSTWIDFFGNVGGLYGLCIGLSFASIVELVWLMIRLFIEVDIIGLFFIQPKKKPDPQKNATEGKVKVGWRE